MKKRIISWVLGLVMTISLVMSDMSMAYAEEILPVDSYEDIENIETEGIENAETECIENIETECIENVETECIENAETECIENAETECIENAEMECIENIEDFENEALGSNSASGESYIFNKGKENETKLTEGHWDSDRYLFKYNDSSIIYALYYSSDTSRVFTQSELSSDKVQFIGASIASASNGSFVTGVGITQRAKEEHKDGYFDYTNAGPGYYRYLIYTSGDKANGFLTSPFLADYKRTSSPYNLSVDAYGKYVEWNPVGTDPYWVEFYYYDSAEGEYKCEYITNGFNHKTSIPDNYDYESPMYFRVKVYSEQGGWSNWTKSSVFYPSANKGKIKDIHFGDPAKGQDPNKIYWNNNLNSEENYSYYYKAEVHTITANGTDTVVGEYESVSPITSKKTDGDISNDDAFDVSAYESKADIQNPFYVMITAYDGKPSNFTSQYLQNHALTNQTMSQKFYFWGGSYAQVNRQNDGKLTTTIKKAVQPNNEYFDKGIASYYSYQWQYLYKIASEWADIEDATKAEYNPTPQELENFIKAGAKIRVKIRNRDYAGELISEEIYAEATKTVKGYANLTFRKGDNVIAIPRADTGTELKVEFVPEEGQGLGTHDLTYVYEWYCNGVKTTGTSDIKSIGYSDHDNTYKCKVTVKVDEGSSSGLTGDKFWSNEITILKGIMDAPTYYSGSEDSEIDGPAVSCHGFSVVRMSDYTEISVTKPGEEHTFSDSDILYYKHSLGLKPLVVDGLEGDTEYEVAYKVPSSNPDLADPCEGTFIVKTKAHTAKLNDTNPEYVYDHYYEGNGEAALPQNVHAKICSVCSPDIENGKCTYFDIEHHVDKDGDNKCDICGAAYSDKGLYIESIGTMPGEKEVYTGKAIKPAVKVYVGDTLLTEGKDYKITYKNNVKACSKDAKNAPSVTVTGIGNYKGTCTEYFTIEPFALGEDKVSGEDLGKPSEGVSVADVAVAYTGKDIKISPVVKVNGATLKQGTDYEVRESVGDSEIKSLKDAGLKTLYVCGIGNYSGAVKFNFVISNDKLISKIKFNKIPNQNYTGEPIAIDDILFVSGKPAKTLKEEFGEGNYLVTYSNTFASGEVKEGNNTNIGTVTATITAKSGSGYCTTGSTTITYKIVGNDISKATVEKVPNQVYAGKAINPDLTVKYKTVSGDIKELIEGTDYVVEYDGTNVNSGTANGTIRGIGIYSGSKKITFKITPYTVTDDDDKVTTYCNGGTTYSKVEYSPKGTKCSAVEAKFKIDPTIASLTEGVDYTVSYSNNTVLNELIDYVWQNPQKIPTAKFSFKGNFKGTRTVNFGIVERSLGNETGTAASGVEVENIVVIYTGKAYTPKFNVKVDGVALKEGKDYELLFTSGEKVSPKVDPDIYYMQIIGKGNYIGWCKTTYEITNKKLISTIKFNKIPDKNYTGEPIDITSEAIVAGKPAQTLSQAIGMYSIKYTNKLANGEVKEGNNTDIGTVIATISANDSSSPYCETGTTTFTYKIVGNDLKNAYLPNKKIADKVYTGSEIVLTNDDLMVAFKNKDNSVSNLVLGKDYDVEYVDGTNINVGTAKIILKGKGIYTGTKSLTFKINPYDVSTDVDKITTDGKTVGNETVTATYSLNSAKPTPVVKFGDEVLTINKDYTISYANNKTVADATAAKAPTMTLKFKGRFKGSRIVKYNITPKSIVADDISINISDVVYSTKPDAWKSKVVIKDGNKSLKEGTDYTLGYYYLDGSRGDEKFKEMNDEEASPGITVLVFIYGKGNYNKRNYNQSTYPKIPGETLSSFKYKYRIGKADIAKAKVGKLSNLEYIAEGQQLTFTYLDGVYKITDSKGNTCDLIVTAADGTLLKAKTDYEIVEDGYSNNENVGSAAFTIRGKGDYCGTKSVKFSIVQRVFVWWKTLFS